MKALGFHEWTDAFNIENIPSTKIDRAYHLETISGSGVKQNQQDVELTTEVSVRFFRKGFRTPADAIDQSLTHLDQVIKDILSPQVRLTQVGIKNITLSGFSLSPLDESNDNTILASVEFSVLTVLDA